MKPLPVTLAIAAALAFGGYMLVPDAAPPTGQATAPDAEFARQQQADQAAEPAVAVRKPTDGDRLSALGQAAVNTGAVTEYDLSVWSGSLDLHVPSLLPGDARAVADAVCTHSRQTFAGQWEQQWKLRVFVLTSSDKPAAVCQL